MSKGRNQPPERHWAVLPYLVELVAYAAVVTVYFLLVLHFLGGAVQNLYETNKTTYALVTLALIAGQGVLMEAITTGLLRLIQRWFKRGE